MSTSNPHTQQIVNVHDLMYHNLLRSVFKYGVDTENRTGVNTRSLFGEKVTFNLADGSFPAITTKKLAWRAVVGEILGFLRGYSNAADFRAIGCKVWDQNANENETWLRNQHRIGEDDLGRIYGVQWRDWRTSHAQSKQSVDQITELVYKLRNNPNDRRMIVTAWNPGELDRMALPPCHMFFQCSVRPENKVDLQVYIRSNDLFLGAPFNIAGYALLLHILCGVSDLTYVPGKLHYVVGDYHIYHNHFDQVKEQLSRDSYVAPTLSIAWPSDDVEERLKWLFHGDPAQVAAAFTLKEYQCHASIAAEMAV